MISNINIINNIDVMSYLGVGFIAMVIGIIAINLIVDKENKKNEGCKYNNFKTYITFFIIGIVIHFIVEQINLDQIYCGKKCQMRIKAQIN
jgi:hypothetical protein